MVSVAPLGTHVGVCDSPQPGSCRPRTLFTCRAFGSKEYFMFHTDKVKRAAPARLPNMVRFGQALRAESGFERPCVVDLVIVGEVAGEGAIEWSRSEGTVKAIS